MVVYIVLEDDRGCGPSVVGVFQHKVDAEQACYGSHMWIVEETIK